MLRRFFVSVKERMEVCIQSAMISLCSGLNRYLQLPPHHRMINLMENDTFIKANKVFNGSLRKNKTEGNDVSQPIKYFQQKDIEKVHDDNFIPGLAHGDTRFCSTKNFLIYYSTQADEARKAYSI